VSVAIFNYIFFFNNSDNLRIATTFMASAIYIFMCAFGLLKAKKKTLLQQVFGFLYCILAIEFIFQVYIALIVFPSIKLFTANTYTSLSFVAVYISMIVADTGFVLLAKQNSDFELIRLANFDELTNIYNRRAFILNAEKSLALFVKKKEPISFILIDLDKFKLINDTFGHGTGDSVLMDFSSKVKMQLKSNDLFGRYGGDEFAIMLPGADSITSNEVAERLRKVIEENSIIENMDMKYTISIGLITLIPDRETNVDFLFKLSDQSLYEAKQNGRNAIVRGNKPEKLSNKNL
jgi:diguanylate cyclase (GGDEF)-like protein